MLIADLIHSCSNDHVARAALACIGGRFAERVGAAAEDKGISVGRYIVTVVRDFARRADDAAHAELWAKMEGDDQPLLKGLRAVLEPALDRESIFFDEQEVPASYIFANFATELRYQ